MRRAFPLVVAVALLCVWTLSRPETGSDQRRQSSATFCAAVPAIVGGEGDYELSFDGVRLSDTPGDEAAFVLPRDGSVTGLSWAIRVTGASDETAEDLTVTCEVDGEASMASSFTPTAADTAMTGYTHTYIEHQGVFQAGDPLILVVSDPSAGLATITEGVVCCEVTYGL